MKEGGGGGNRGGEYNVGTIFEVGQRNNPYFKVVGPLFVCLSVTSVTILMAGPILLKTLFCRFISIVYDFGLKKSNSGCGFFENSEKPGL